MTATIDASAIFNAGVAANQTINLPSGISSGDLLIGYFAESSNAPGPFSISFPTGWTTLKNLSASSELVIGFRHADGLEGSTITMVNDNGTTASSVIARVSSHLAAADPEVSTGVASASFGDPDPDNLAPAAGSEDILWLCFGCIKRESQAITAVSTNYTVVNGIQTTTGGNNGHSSAMGERALTASSEDPGVYTAGNRTWEACTVAIRPAAAAGGLILPRHLALRQPLIRF